MTAKVFLSLSFVDADFVRGVQARLPKGLAYFYEKSFETGEDLLAAMTRSVQDSAIFVLFASKKALDASWATRFEISAARLTHARVPNHRVMVFPTDPTVAIGDLPEWLRQYWMAKAGYSVNDVARFITTALLEPDSGLSSAAIKVVGRGASLDDAERISADFLSRKKQMPPVFVFGGFPGIGRRTFAQYYMRRGLPANANLPVGPTFVLPPQTDLIDIYRELRSEIGGKLTAQVLAKDLATFGSASQGEQVKEIVSLIDYFAKLGQAVTLASNSGFFEDRGAPKDWAEPLLRAISPDATVFLVTNRLFPTEFIERLENVVQMKVQEIAEKDVRTLMVHTADRLKVPDFKISDAMLQAIGGHADVANAAVRLAKIKGTAILERDPRQLLNIQQTILGESIAEGALSDDERMLLSTLSWVPGLSGDLLGRVAAEMGVGEDQFVAAVERLVLACLVAAAGSIYSIAPSIRMLFRRFHVSSPALLSTFAHVLDEEWKASQDRGEFRPDLFDAFVFMHALEGQQLPPELRSLLMPGTLNEIVRTTHARGKDEEDDEKLQQAIKWGELANSMKMSEATREDIMSTVVRAKILLGKMDAATADIAKMEKHGYRSVLFLRGYMLRKQRRFRAGADILEQAVRERKNFRSVLHELAICYSKSSQNEKLRALLQEHKGEMRDSAMFTDFQVGIDLARNDLGAVEAGIASLRSMPDDGVRSNKRQAQLLMRKGNYAGALALLSRVIGESKGAQFGLRCLRATAATRCGDLAQALRDIEWVKSSPGRGDVALALRADYLAVQSKFDEADAALAAIKDKSPEDYHLEARILDLKADSAITPFGDREKLRERAVVLRAKYGLALDYDSTE